MLTHVSKRGCDCGIGSRGVCGELRWTSWEGGKWVRLLMYSILHHYNIPSKVLIALLGYSILVL